MYVSSICLFHHYHFFSIKAIFLTFELPMGTIHSTTLTITFARTIGILWTSVFLGNGIVSCKWQFQPFSYHQNSRTWSQVLLLLSFLFLGKKNLTHTQNMFGLLLGTLDYLQMAGSKDPINLQQPQLHLISRIIGLNKEIKWKPRKTTEKNWKCSHLVKVEPDEIVKNLTKLKAW